MKLKHKKLVQYIYPEARCTRNLYIDHYMFEVDVKGRMIGSAKSSAGAWADAYNHFSTHLKRKAQQKA